MKAWGHFKTITKHRFIVMTYCFRAGLIRQGLTHDLSKYSPTEFLIGAKYFTGEKSPNVLERQEKGYSSSWIHHKGRNKHHFEYWVDTTMEGFVPVEMPVNYVAEMLFDRIAACKTYNGKNYTDAAPLAYYNRGYDARIMHELTRQRLELLLNMLADEGEAKTMDYIRNVLLKKQ